VGSTPRGCDHDPVTDQNPAPDDAAADLARLSYDEALDLGRRLNPGISIGKPGKSSMWPVALRAFDLLRVKIAVTCTGADNVAPGAAIVVANHQSTWDPVVTVMATGWHVSAFTKAEWYDGPAARFFSLLGQIPIRRGDDAATDWALDMARRTLESGVKIGIYPEGTRGPDPDTLYRLHQRVLVPLIRQNPTVPVHTVAARFSQDGRRARARLVVSERLPLDTETMTDDELTAIVRDSLIEGGRLNYVDDYALRVKRALKAGGAQPPAAAGDDPA
jgi:1-acyl-sn-glycerol-3-phosphate acyltransferase